MKTSECPAFPASSQTRKANPKLRAAIIILEVATVIALLVIWWSCKSVQQNKSLWVLLFYSLPSQFLIALVPHEPALLYFGKFYAPLTVALVAVAGTLLTEMLNYSVFGFVADARFSERMRASRVVRKATELFNRAPFLALAVAGFTPVPFYPFRFLVVLAHYPAVKYALAVFLSRTPRFYILAMLGREIRIPDFFLLMAFVFLVLIMCITLLKSLLRKPEHQ